MLDQSSRVLPRRAFLASSAAAFAGCSVLSSESDSSVTPGAVRIANLDDSSHTITISVTDGPRTPERTLTVDAAKSSKSSTEVVTTDMLVENFLDIPGCYNLEATLKNGNTDDWNGISVWENSEGVLSSEIPEIIIRDEKDVDIQLFQRDPPPESKNCPQNITER